MRPLLTAEEMRLLDSRTMEEIGLPGAVLMETAGRGIFRALWERFGERARDGSVAVICGKGNNGGDGFVVARCLHNLGCRTTALLLGSRSSLRGEAAVHLGAYLAGGGALVEVSDGVAGRVPEPLERASLVVDAIFGTGLSEDVRGTAAAAIGWINASAAPVVSVDLPSGVSADTGRICGAAVEAELTVTPGHPKRGHYLYPGAALVGELEVVDIGIPPSLVELLTPGLCLVEAPDCCGLLSRPLDSHKGTFGHVLVFGGSAGKEGAAGLAATAALRAGAGLASVVCPAAVRRELAPRLPLELMTVPLPGADSSELEWAEGLWPGAEAAARLAQALVAGPGMGADEGSARFLARLLGSTALPLVLDADGLNALAAHPELWSAPRPNTVLTPHPGEAGRLLGADSRKVQEDRWGTARTLAERFGCVIVLKGAHPLVAAPDGPVLLIAEGNPGMATAGSGDVLSGVVGAFLARGLSAVDAAWLGAYAHALAGDRAAADLGREGMIAGDILERLPRVLRELGR